jgi:hypothetical protein
LLELSDEEEGKEGDLVAPSQNSVAKGIPVGEVQTSSVQLIASSGGGLKQSSLASFLFKPSEKDPEVEAEQSHNSTETGNHLPLFQPSKCSPGSRWNNFATNVMQ